jgi:hypothetical protein
MAVAVWRRLADADGQDGVGTVRSPYSATCSIISSAVMNALSSSASHQLVPGNAQRRPGDARREVGGVPVLDELADALPPR